jgi:hypothetical protein
VLIVAITGVEIRDNVHAFGFSWQPEDDIAIFGTLTSGREGVALSFGPTVTVAHWPAWLLAITHFGETGGEAGIWLDPHRQAERTAESFWALDMRGATARATFATFLTGLADAIANQAGDVAEERLQAAGACHGMALALTSVAQGTLQAPAEWPELFWPSALPLILDDHDPGPSRRHVRLTYQLPRVAGWLTAGCSLRLFQSKQSFGIEFRALIGDLLPAAILPACIEDGFGPLLRVTIDRGGAHAIFEGEAQADEALRIMRAVVRQVSRDIAMDPALPALTGFRGGAWGHWLAALPDLLASPSLMSLDVQQDH